MLPLKVLGKDRFQASLLASGSFLAAERHLHVVVSLCVCESEFPLFIRTPVIPDQGPTLLQYDLLLANYIVQWPYFQIKSCSEVLGVQTLAYESTAVQMFSLKMYQKLDTKGPLPNLRNNRFNFFFFLTRRRCLKMLTLVVYFSCSVFPNLNNEHRCLTFVRSNHRWRSSCRSSSGSQPYAELMAPESSGSGSSLSICPRGLITSYFHPGAPPPGA